MPTLLDVVRPVRKVVEALLQSAGWSEDDAADAGLVVTEVVQNAVEHGSRADGGELVTVRGGMVGDVLELDVEDPGSGKGPASLIDRDVTVPPPADSSRGRGLYLVHRLSEHFDRRRTATGGSVVRVCLRPAAAS
ncbi:MAG: ATP-binding protein [Planctomycetes bacterium]|nr:ATP-binding protein [Planctomycetota bacterium]